MLVTEFLEQFRKMNKNIFCKRVFALFIASLIISSLTGCGRDASLDLYKENMENYFAAVSEINDGMNSIDALSASNDDELRQDYSALLSYLDKLDELTAQMAEVKVPEQFELAESLADEASENMSKAVLLYHNVYEGSEYNPSEAEAAFEYYSRANKRIRYVKSILQGDIPDELHVEYETEEE